MEISANSWEEMKAEGMKHLEATHPEIAEGMKNQTPEEIAKWDVEGETKFNALPDVQ